MPAPGLTYVTVSDVLYRGDGSFDHGVLEFKIPFPIRRSGVVMLTTTTFTVTILPTDNGAFTISLPASDDSTNNPAQWLYEVESRTTEWNQTFYLNVPIAKASGGAKLSELLPATPAQAAFDLSSFLQKSGGTMTGSLILAADPTVALGAATKQYVDNSSSAGVPDATGSVKGKVQLAGDLSGTAASPTVPALSGKASTVHSHSESDVTNLTTDLANLSSSVAGKANTSHTHAESDVTNLTADLAAKIAVNTLTTKGDVLTRTASSLARQGIGSDGQVLTADSSQANGLKWATPSAGGGSGPNLLGPDYYGLKAFTGDPQWMQNVQSVFSNTVWYAAIPVVVGQVISELWVANAAVATYDNSSTGNGLALADFSGSLLGQTADLPSLWSTAIGWRGAAMAGSFTYTVPSTGFLYLLALMRGMTNGALCFPPGCTDGHAPFSALGPTQTKARAGYGSGSSIPSSFDPTNYGTKSGFMFLGGVK